MLRLAAPTQLQHAAFYRNWEKLLVNHLWLNYQEPQGNVFAMLHDNLSFPSALPSFSAHPASSPDFARHPHSLPLPLFLYAPLRYDVSYHTRTCHANQAAFANWFFKKDLPQKHEAWRVQSPTSQEIYCGWLDSRAGDIQYKQIQKQMANQAGIYFMRCSIRTLESDYFMCLLYGWLRFSNILFYSHKSKIKQEKPTIPEILKKDTYIWQLLYRGKCKRSHV